MILKHTQLSQHLGSNLLPIYLIHGDESLIVEESQDLIRQAARKRDYSERIVFDIEGNFNWNEFSSEAQALSLFSQRKSIEIRLNSGKVSDKGKALEEFCDTADGDTVVIITSPRLDKNVQKQAWFKKLEKIGASSIIWPLKTRDIQEWSSLHCRKQGKTIQYDALQLLLEKTEGNLLATKQEIDKLCISIDGNDINLETMMHSIADSARYTVFDLSDNCLKGDVAMAAHVFNHLRSEGSELLALSGLMTREIRALNSLIYYSQSMSIEQAFLKAKVWKNKQGIYRTAVNRLSKAKLENLLKASSNLDLAVKGMSDEKPWHLFFEICMALAGNQHLKMRKTG